MVKTLVDVETNAKEKVNTQLALPIHVNQNKEDLDVWLGVESVEEMDIFVFPASIN